MKKILSLVLAVIMIMAMAIPAFAATEEEISPCAVCNGNHTYEKASNRVTYECVDGECKKTTVTYYKCVFCSDSYSSAPVTVTVAHSYKRDGNKYICIHCGDDFVVS